VVARERLPVLKAPCIYVHDIYVHVSTVWSIQLYHTNRFGQFTKHTAHGITVPVTSTSTSVPYPIWSVHLMSCHTLWSFTQTVIIFPCQFCCERERSFLRLPGASGPFTKPPLPKVVGRIPPEVFGRLSPCRRVVENKHSTEIRVLPTVKVNAHTDDQARFSDSTSVE